MEIQTEELLAICKAFAAVRTDTTTRSINIIDPAPLIDAIDAATGAQSILDIIRGKPRAAAQTLEWSSTLCDGEVVDYETAEKACAARGGGWRLPTRMELESILDLTRHDPAVDTKRFPDTKSTWYWTSTPCAWAPGAAAWVVGFYRGYADGSGRNHYACVRAVRSVQSKAEASA